MNGSLTASLPGLLKILFFLLLGLSLKRKGVLDDDDIRGIKKIIIHLAIPAVLYLSFSRLSFDLGFLSVTAAVFSLNLILFGVGVLLYRLTGSGNRLLPLLLSTMNFALIGIPLYEAVYGIERLHHYTVLGLGNELFVWFVFYFLFRWFLNRERAEKGVLSGFFRSPIIWGIILGCLTAALGNPVSGSGNPLVRGIYQSLTALSGLTTPLILIFIGYNIALSGDSLKKSLGLVILRLALMYGIGYGLKLLFIDPVLHSADDPLFEAAYFLLLSLPAIFSLPILAADYLDERETGLLNNTIVLHALVTILLFAGYTLLRA